jgi:PAS domain S-box-containing protein
MSTEREVAAEGQKADFPRMCRYLSERSPQPMIVVEGKTYIIEYLNPAFAKLVGKEGKDLVGRPFAEAVPEEAGNGCLALLDRVFRTGMHEILAEQEHLQTAPQTVYWSYSMWAILGTDDRPVGVMVQISDTTEIAIFRQQAAAMNEALLLSSIRQHDLVGIAESLNDRLREAHDRMEERVVERTAELDKANRSLRNEIAFREVAEAERLDLLRRLATAQEDERRRIARDLHDQMGQLITGLGLGLKALEGANPDLSSSGSQLARLRELTVMIGREVHQIALELRPTALDDLGLKSALMNFAEKWAERSGVEVDFQDVGTDTGRLPDATETALYRVVQEALTNVLKHAKARRVSVVLQCSLGHASVVIEDNGVGFEVESLADKGRLGLLGMRERLALVSGTLTIESKTGGGTTVIARIPRRPGGSE